MSPLLISCVLSLRVMDCAAQSLFIIALKCFHVNFDVKKLFMRNLSIGSFPKSKLDVFGFKINDHPEGLCAIRISLYAYFFALLMRHRSGNIQNIILTFTTLFASHTIESKQRRGDKMKTTRELINTNRPF